jgi:hypothetical protein
LTHQVYWSDWLGTEDERLWWEASVDCLSPDKSPALRNGLVVLLQVVQSELIKLKWITIKLHHGKPNCRHHIIVWPDISPARCQLLLMYRVFK